MKNVWYFLSVKISITCPLALALGEGNLALVKPRNLLKYLSFVVLNKSYYTPDHYLTDPDG
jgi:hypothetical protein